LFLDAFLAFVYGDSASLFEHNVVEHDTDRVLVSQKVLWRLFSHVILLSGHSLEKYCTLSRRSNGLLLQHPLIDGEAPRDTFPRITVPRFAFVGASRGNRGLKCLLNIFGSLPSLELVVFSCVDEEVRRLVKKMNNVTIVSGYLDRDMFQNILKQDYVFVLPYIESTQSGIFYSLLSNRSVFVATNTGDVGRKMGGGKLNKCFFDLGSASSFLRAVQYLESDECLMRFEELRSLVERDFDHGYIALKNKTVIDVKN